MAYLIEAGWKFASDVCRALGIDPEQRCVKKIVIEIGVDECVKVHIQEYLDQGQCKAIVDLLPAAKRDMVEITTDRPVVVDDFGKVRID